MLKIMAHENDEMYGSSFLVTLETVRSLVEAHAKEEIKKLSVDYRGGHGRVSLADLGFGRDPAETWVSPIAVGRYFGWMKGNGRPKEKVLTALHALQLIAGGHCTEQQFQGIGNEQALAVVRHAAATVREHTRDAERAEKAAKKLAAKAKTSTGAQKVAAEKLKDDQQRRSGAAIFQCAATFPQGTRGDGQVHRGRRIMTSRRSPWTAGDATTCLG